MARIHFSLEGHLISHKRKYKRQPVLGQRPKVKSPDYQRQGALLTAFARGGSVANLRGIAEKWSDFKDTQDLGSRHRFNTCWR